MCDKCDCDNYMKCSIHENTRIPLGFCCPKCVFYEGESACMRSKMNVKKKIPASLKDDDGKIRLFPEKFCLKTKPQTGSHKIDI